MPKRDLIFRNPLRVLGGDGFTILPEGGFGAVVARAGVGKTSFLVQIALERMLHKQDVLHISLSDPLDKVLLWYDELLSELGKIYDKRSIQELWEEIRTHRFVMTFAVEQFSVKVLETRLLELTEQKILSPKILLIDGLSFENKDTVFSELQALKEMAEKYHLRCWFAVRIHRHTDTDPSELPPELKPVEKFFDMVIRLQPNGKRDEVQVKVIKHPKELSSPEIVLEPKTMLVISSSD